MIMLEADDAMYPTSAMAGGITDKLGRILTRINSRNYIIKQIGFYKYLAV